jgi:transcriptional regulator with XRE-family HTH domain
MGFRENLKSAIAYKGLMVKELADLSGVNKYSIDNYLGARGQLPTVDSAVKLARTLGVSVEYLVLGDDRGIAKTEAPFDREIRTIVRLAEKLPRKKRRFVVDFLRWINEREDV